MKLIKSDSEYINNVTKEFISTLQINIFKICYHNIFSFVKSTL